MIYAWYSLRKRYSARNKSRCVSYANNWLWEFIVSWKYKHVAQKIHKAAQMEDRTYLLRSRKCEDEILRVLWNWQLYENRKSEAADEQI